MPNRDMDSPSPRTVILDPEAVRRRRRARGLTQDTLATEAGMSKSSIEAIESPRSRPVFVTNLTRLAAVLDVPLADLVCEAEKAQFRPDLGTAEPTATPAAGLVSSALFQLPDAIPDMVGRDDLVAELVARLQAGGPIGLSALRGMGGVGKTSLAVYVARQVQNHFPDARIFLDMLGVSEQPVPPAAAMLRILRAFRPELTGLPESERELLPYYRNALAGKRALIVLDNASGEAQVKNLIAGEKTGFIITSRNALALQGIVSVRVDVLAPRDSLILLRGITGARGTDDELRTVAELCGHLPLALRVAGDFVRVKEEWAVGRYIEALTQERLRWLSVGDDPERNVEAVLKLSSAQLVRDNWDLATRWHLLADWPSDFEVAAAAMAWGMDPNDTTLLDDLSKLVGRSMVLFDPRTHRYRLHDLMKPIAARLFG